MGRGKLVFPGNGKVPVAGVKLEPRPISENTMNAALRRLGYSADEVTAHGFRASASTMLNETGDFSFDVIEAALAHQDPDAVRRAYNRAKFWGERVRLQQASADQVDAMRDGA